MLRSSTRRALPLAAAALLAIAFPASAATSYNNEITFTTAGAEGNFDMDSQVSDGSGAFWGTESQTDWDTAHGTPHFFKVRTGIGKISSSSFSMGSITLINDYASTDDPDDGGTKTLGWAHEVASLAYDSFHSKWVVVYSSMPKHQPDSTHIYGKNEVKYGWLARMVFNNTSGQTAPNMSTLPKEDRIICGGGSAGCVNTLYSATSSWAQGTPTNYNWIDPTNGPCASYPTNCSNGRYYIAWTEPGLIADSSGNVYMSLTGIFDADSGSGTDYRGDVHYFKSTDSGLTWTWVAKTLDYTDAAHWGSNYSYFTGSSLWWDGSSLRLVVTSTDIDEGSADKDALYRGMREFKYTSVTSGVLNKTSGYPTQYWCGDYSAPSPASPHRGAGGYYPASGQHQMSILFPDGEGASGGLHKDFHVYEANGTDC